MKKLLLLLLVFPFVFAACSDDDDDDKNPLVGTWKFASYTVIEKDLKVTGEEADVKTVADSISAYAKTVQANLTSQEMTFTFAEDGKVTVKAKDQEAKTVEYKESNNKITFTVAEVAHTLERSGNTLTEVTDITESLNLEVLKVDAEELEDAEALEIEKVTVETKFTK